MAGRRPWPVTVNGVTDRSGAIAAPPIPSPAGHTATQRTPSQAICACVWASKAAYGSALTTTGFGDELRIAALTTGGPFSNQTTRKALPLPLTAAPASLLFDCTTSSVAK